MKTIIQFSVLKEKDGGYSANAVGFPIFTQADSFEVLEKNIIEATELYFEDEDMRESGFIGNPSLMLNMEIVRPVYA